MAISFSEAAAKVDSIVNNIEEKPFKADIDLDRRRKNMNETWSIAQEPQVAVEYLLNRGIPLGVVEQVSADIRGASALRLYDGKHDCGCHRAMVALIRNAKGVPISIHRTYLGVDGKQKKIMPPLENITGGCVRLGEPENTLVLAEGIETALAASAITGYPAWATISAHGLAEFKGIPRHVKKVIICADNDASFTGQAAAFECAKYMKQRVKVETIVTMPKIIGMDMLDVFNELRDGKVRTNSDGGLMRWAT